MRFSRWLIPAALALTAAQLPAQFPPDSFTNLRVLPQGIHPDSLVQLMASFTRALAVRCTYCHVGEERQPLSTYDFASDEKLTKRKARTMLSMVQHINQEHLGELEERLDPPVRVQCATCHRGATEPRMLQDVLWTAYEAAGLDSAISTYRALRDRYFGRYTYDFSTIVLPDVAGRLVQQNQLADAERLLAMNVDLYPESPFAQRQHATIAIGRAFAEAGAERGEAVYHALRPRYGDAVFGESFLNNLGYSLLGRGLNGAAIAVFRLNVDEYPDAFNTYDSLGEAYMVNGETALAIQNYERSLERNPQNTNAREKLRELRGGR